VPRRPNEGLPDVEEYQCIAQFRSLIQAGQASRQERACQKGPALPPARAIGVWSRSARSSPPSRRGRATRRTVLVATPRSRHEVVSREERDDPRWTTTRSCVESRRTPGPDTRASSPGGGSGSVPGRSTFERRADPAPGRARSSRGSTTRLRMRERPPRTRGVRGRGARARRPTTPPRRSSRA
jgi:hypothetical protein